MSHTTFEITGNVVDVLRRRIFPSVVSVANGKIADVREKDGSYSTFLLPGLIDSHVHV